MNTLPMSPFLRNLLAVDAAASAATALPMLAAAPLLAEWTGLPATGLAVAGGVMAVYVAVILWWRRQPTVRRGALWAYVVGNALWAVECALIAFGGWLVPTPLGVGFLMMQAVAVI
eukprot:gene6613-8939_t